MFSDDDRAALRVAIAQESALAAVQRLLALEGDDPDIGAVMVVAHADGSADVTLLGTSGAPVGGYSL